MPAGRKLKQAEVIAVGKLLEQHYDAEKGRYKDGASDETIAGMALALKLEGVGPQHIAGVRRAVYGNFTPQPKGIELEILTRLAQIEARLTTLEEARRPPAQEQLPLAS